MAFLLLGQSWFPGGQSRCLYVKAHEELTSSCLHTEASRPPHSGHGKPAVSARTAGMHSRCMCCASALSILASSVWCGAAFGAGCLCLDVKMKC